MCKKYENTYLASQTRQIIEKPTQREETRQQRRLANLPARFPFRQQRKQRNNTKWGGATPNKKPHKSMGSYCCHSHIRPCLTSCFTCFSVFTTLVATRRRCCLLRSARVNVMPEWLLSVISRILAGGIPGFRSELCCFFHPFSWPLRVVPCCLRFASCSVAILMMTHKFSSCTSFLRAGSDPTSLWSCLVWFCCGFVCFVCLLLSVCVLFFYGTAHWTVLVHYQRF